MSQPTVLHHQRVRSLPAVIGVCLGGLALLTPPVLADPMASGVAPVLTAEQQFQRCNTGRLVGGLGGGAAAYAMSRGNGRAWAIPLGALLGSQVGCSVAARRQPLPW